MKREIKFRGLRTDAKGWSIGFMVADEDDTIWIVKGVGDSYTWDEVIPDSVGQYTGLQDKNGADIYEGDKVSRKRVNYAHDEINNPNVPLYKKEESYIEYRYNGFWVQSEDFGWEGEDLWDWGEMEIIGNIHEPNPRN